MIKRITLLVRKDGTTRSRFRDYWRAEHAAIVVQMPSIAGYLQNPVCEELCEDIGRLPPYQFDGIVELWFADAAAQQRAFASPAGKRLPADEPNFIKGITLLTISEVELRPGVAATKAMLVLNLGANLTAEVRTRALIGIENQAAALPGVTRVVANRVIGTGVRDGLWSEPTPPELLIELGTDSQESMKAAIASPAFGTIGERIRFLDGRLALRLLEERKVV